MKISRGFISNSSTYSFLTYVSKDKLNQVVIGSAEELLAKYGNDDAIQYYAESFYPLKVSDFGEPILSKKDFIVFLKRELRLNFSDSVIAEKSPDNYDDKNNEKADAKRAISHLKEYDDMVNKGYIPIYVIQSSEDDGLEAYLAYIGDVPFDTIGGFEVIG